MDSITCEQLIKMIINLNEDEKLIISREGIRVDKNE